MCTLFILKCFTYVRIFFFSRRNLKLQPLILWEVWLQNPSVFLQSEMPSFLNQGVWLDANYVIHEFERKIVFKRFTSYFCWNCKLRVTTGWLSSTLNAGKDRIESDGTSDSKLIACLFIYLFIYFCSFIYPRHSKITKNIFNL